MDNTLEARGMGTCVQERRQARSQELQTSTVLPALGKIYEKLRGSK